MPNKKASTKRVFIGLDNTAGISSRLKKGFDQIGIEADFYSFNRHQFGYEPDILVEYSQSKLKRKFQKFFLLVKLLMKYKYFFYLSTNSLLPRYKDIKLFKRFGKRTMVFFTGCDVRMPEKVAQFKYNPCRNCPQEYKDFVGCVIETKRKRTELMEQVFDDIICHIPDAGYLTKPYHLAFSPVNLENFPPEKYGNYKLHDKLRILHAPTNEDYKGSKYIYEALDKLKGKYDFELVLIKGVSIEKLYEEIQNSDLIIDQMIGGGYGLFSQEAMAMYRPVVCYIREDLWEKIKHDCPIYNASPDNLYDVLEGILANPAQLIERSKQSREFIEKYHDARKIAKQYYDIFERRN